MLQISNFNVFILSPTSVFSSDVKIEQLENVNRLAHQQGTLVTF